MSSLKHIKVNFLIKFLRIFVFTLSLIGLLFYVNEVYQKWFFNPDIMTNELIIPSHRVPMPAITICSPSISEKKYIEHEDFFQLFWHICDLEYSKIVYEISTKSFGNPVKLLDQFSPKINEIFDYCYFKEEDKSCKKLFRRVFTEYGFCFTLNLLDIDEIFDMEVISEDFKSYEQRYDEVANTR